MQSTADEVVIRDVQFFGQMVPFGGQLEVACARRDDRVGAVPLFIELEGVWEQVEFFKFVFTCGIHFFEFVEDWLASGFADICFCDEEVGFVVVFGGDSWVEEGDIDSCEDEIFG